MKGPPDGFTFRRSGKAIPIPVSAPAPRGPLLLHPGQDVLHEEALAHPSRPRDEHVGGTRAWERGTITEHQGCELNTSVGSITASGGGEQVRSRLEKI